MAATYVWVILNFLNYFYIQVTENSVFVDSFWSENKQLLKAEYGDMNEIK